jgi:hypothetical protein
MALAAAHIQVMVGVMADEAAMLVSKVAVVAVALADTLVMAAPAARVPLASRLEVTEQQIQEQVAAALVVAAMAAAAASVYLELEQQEQEQQYRQVMEVLAQEDQVISMVVANLAMAQQVYLAQLELYGVLADHILPQI